MRRIINKKCQQIFSQNQNFVEPAKIFSDLINIIKKDQEGLQVLEVPKQNEYLTEMTPAPKIGQKLEKQLVNSKSNVSVLGLKRGSKLYQQEQDQSSTQVWETQKETYFSVQMPLNKKMIRVNSHDQNLAHDDSTTTLVSRNILG